MKNIAYGKKALLDHIDDDIINVDLLSTQMDIIKILKEKKINYRLRGMDFFSNLSPYLNHQGVIVTLKQNNKYQSLEDLVKDKSKKESIVLVVDGLQDPQNFGAIIRTSDAFGVDAIIYKKDNQVQINDFVIKSSMGAINRVPLFKVSNLTQALTTLKKAGY
jgi:23S rRNA (guanosine2251-2'-O)-methyltransferase